MDLQELEDKLLTIREAAAFLRLSERTIWELTGPRGDLPAIRFRRSVRYSHADLLDYVERHRVGNGGDEA